MKTHVIGNRIYLASLVLSSEPVKVEHFAILPNQESDRLPVWVHDWKGEGDKFKITYSFSNESTAAIHDMTLPAGNEETELLPPRGRGWTWDFGKWVRRTMRGREEIIPS